MADGLSAVILHRHGDHVEPTANTVEPPQFQVMLGEPDEPALLSPGDGRAGRVAPAGLAALHLDEDPALALAADEIELALREPDVTLDDAES